MLVEVGVAPRLDAGEGENGDDAGTASRGGAAAREVATLEEEVRNLEFPNLEDGTGSFWGEKPWTTP
ncbi:unnamed protein product [Ectocarpus sp. 8 AP-2014]